MSRLDIEGAGNVGAQAAAAARASGAAETGVDQSPAIAPDAAQSAPTPFAHVLPEPVAPACAVAYRDVASSRPIVTPLSEARYSLKLTIGQEAHDMLERAQALLRHAVPDGGLTYEADLWFGTMRVREAGEAWV